MLFQPIALDEQAKDLLRAGQYEQALHLAGICAADGAPWAETAFAETALLLLHGRLPLDINQTPLTLMCTLVTAPLVLTLLCRLHSLNPDLTQKLSTLSVVHIPSAWSSTTHSHKTLMFSTISQSAAIWCRGKV